MRLLVAWVFFVSVAAVSHYIAAPAVRAWSADSIATATATEGGRPPLAAFFFGELGGGLLEWVLPILAIGAAVVLTLQVLIGKLTRAF